MNSPNHNSLISDSATIGQNVEIGKNCLISSHANIADGCKIGDYCSIGINVKIGSNTTIGSYTEIRDDARIGSNCSLGSRCTISAGGLVGDDVTLKYSFVLTDTMDIVDNKNKQPGIIEDKVSVGACVTLMPGIKIGRGSVVGAMSQIRHDVPRNEVWFGNPASFHKSI
jgi:acetyltransferase-like isoleucine patch superfamily enzyme